MEASTQENTPRGRRRSLQGTVVGTGMDKTITVRVERTSKHPKYKKYVRTHTKYMAHDEENVACVGDTVVMTECRPLSKSKRWRLTDVVAKAVIDEGGVL
jgi:small subunit ribosomal protein S17